MKLIIVLPQTKAQNEIACTSSNRCDSTCHGVNQELVLDFDVQDDFEVLKFQIISLLLSNNEDLDLDMDVDSFLLFDFLGRRVTQKMDIVYLSILSPGVTLMKNTVFENEAEDIFDENRKTKIQLYLFYSKFVDMTDSMPMPVDCTASLFQSNPGEKLIQPCHRIADTPFMVCEGCSKYVDNSLLASSTNSAAEIMDAFCCNRVELMDFGMIPHLSHCKNTPLLSAYNNPLIYNSIQFKSFMKRSLIESTIRSCMAPASNEAISRFHQRLQSGRQTVTVYEDPIQQREARRYIDIELIRQYMNEYFMEGQASQGMMGVPKDVAFVKGLLKWFKRDFFKWFNKPTCSNVACVAHNKNEHQTPNPVQYAGTTTQCEPHEKAGWAGRIECYNCPLCSKTIRFPRYNNPSVLCSPIGRVGRCGEWANAFGLICRSLSLDIQYALDFTDHVWCEVYIPSYGRYVHVDPCEMAFDTPLLYEAGWNKELTYVIGFSRMGVVDLTPKYTRKFDDVLLRRHNMVLFEKQAKEVLARHHQEQRTSWWNQLNSNHINNGNSNIEACLEGFFKNPGMYPRIWRNLTRVPDYSKTFDDAPSNDSFSLNDDRKLDLNIDLNSNFGGDSLLNLTLHMSMLQFEVLGYTCLTTSCETQLKRLYFNWSDGSGESKLGGRVSGDQEWKLSRGEIKPDAVTCGESDECEKNGRLFLSHILKSRTNAENSAHSEVSEMLLDIVIEFPTVYEPSREINCGISHDVEYIYGNITDQCCGWGSNHIEETPEILQLKGKQRALSNEKHIKRMGCLTINKFPVCSFPRNERNILLVDRLTDGLTNTSADNGFSPVSGVVTRISCVKVDYNRDFKATVSVTDAVNNINTKSTVTATDRTDLSISSILLNLLENSQKHENEVNTVSHSNTTIYSDIAIDPGLLCAPLYVLIYVSMGGCCHPDTVPFNGSEVIIDYLNRGIDKQGPSSNAIGTIDDIRSIFIDRIDGWTGDGFLQGLQLHYHVDTSNVKVYGNDDQTPNADANGRDPHTLMSPKILNLTHNNNPTKSTFTITKGDRISKVIVRYGNIVDSVTFFTENGCVHIFGGTGGGSEQVYDIPRSCQFIGVYGGVGGHIHHFGLILLKDQQMEY